MIQNFQILQIWGYRYLVYVYIYIVGINNIVINNCIHVKVTNSSQLNYKTNPTHNSNSNFKYSHFTLFSFSYNLLFWINCDSKCSQLFGVTFNLNWTICQTMTSLILWWQHNLICLTTAWYVRCTLKLYLGIHFLNFI